MSTRSLRVAVLTLAVLAVLAAGLARRADAQGARPKRGGILNTVLIEDPPGLIIHESATVSNVWPMSPCYSNLVFFLRRNVKWHDGKPFTSADVKYTFDVAREAPEAPARLRLSR